MNQNTLEILEFEKIKTELKGYALSDMAKKAIEKLEPSLDKRKIEQWLLETTEARNIVDRSSSIPLNSLTGIDKIREKLGKTDALQPEELEAILGFLKDCSKLKSFMVREDFQYIAPNISSYAASIFELEDLVQEIERCIVRGQVDDKASAQLSKLRKRINIIEERIRVKVEAAMKNPKYKNFIQDSVISIRNGRFVIPIKSQYKNNVAGSILDSSASGSTVFIEPEEVKKLHDELKLCKIEEENEVFRILCCLTSELEAYSREISINIETMALYDFLIAKGKYSRYIEGNMAEINTDNFIRIVEGRHPLLGKEAVPLNLTIGDDYRSLVITGPNTGGKTVVLKTVGLLTIMVQCGLHVPVKEGSSFAIFADILADIGDGQSIEQSLSTFSSHIKNIINILNCADKHSLVILDELGAGTDPGEGMGIAVAVLEELYSKGVVMLATTHYSEIKEFAAQTPGFKNGCMEFDINTLKPLYRLVVGKAGESNAFLIALRLGMKKELIEKAHRITYKEEKKYDGLLAEDKKESPLLEEAMKEHHNEQLERLKENIKMESKAEKLKAKPKFKVGDCVYISTMDRTGIVCEPENSKGEVTVMVMRKKFKINHKRLSLYIDSKELYPEDYNFDIIFESKENRKKKHLMSKRHVEGLIIEE
ncbi:MAG: endonuclease MutS2 [Clostridiales bacterium]|nr:endonuclease MutS2 [Clostridiales bacterium]